MITTHRLAECAFTPLANGVSDSTVVRQLREAQHSKHLILLRAVAEAAAAGDPASPAVGAFRAGYKLLATVQAVGPDAATWLLGLPHIGGWAHDCLIRLDQGSPPDFAYLACAAAAAAIRAGTWFELDAPVRDGQVLLPGLGSFPADQRPWVRLHSDGSRLITDGLIGAPCAALVPGGDPGGTVPQRSGTPLIRATADGQAWDVLLEITDRYLDRYTLPMSSALTTEEIGNCGTRVPAPQTLRADGRAAPPYARKIAREGCPQSLADLPAQAYSRCPCRPCLVVADQHGSHVGTRHYQRSGARRNGKAQMSSEYQFGMQWKRWLDNGYRTCPCRNRSCCCHRSSVHGRNT